MRMRGDGLQLRANTGAADSNNYGCSLDEGQGSSAQRFPERRV